MLDLYYGVWKTESAPSGYIETWQPLAEEHDFKLDYKKRPQLVGLNVIDEREKVKPVNKLFALTEIMFKLALL